MLVFINSINIIIDLDKKVRIVKLLLKNVDEWFYIQRMMMKIWRFFVLRFFVLRMLIYVIEFFFIFIKILTWHF